MGVLFSRSCRHVDDDDNDIVAKDEPRDETTRRESIFYDALQSLPPESMKEYLPASRPLLHPRGSFVMSKPVTLLLPKEKMKRRTTMSVRELLKQPSVKVERRGYPGYLTEEELEICLNFRRELKEHPDSAYQEMVNCFEGVEEEPYALCRFLRARNFNVDDSLDMIQDNVEKWKLARQHNFYPDIQSAAGCPESVFSTQLPYFQSGSAKNGCIVDYLMAGRMSVEGVECVTEISRVKNAMWHSYMHSFQKQVAIAQESNPNTVRCEVLSIVDLSGLDPSQLNKKSIDALKSFGETAGCFPEVMNKMVIINAPRVFGFFWRIIRNILHPRTAAKIEIYCKPEEGMGRLLELIDTTQLLSDYGGEGQSYSDLLQTKGNESGQTRHVAELIAMNGTTRPVVELGPNEKATVCVYSRCNDGHVTLLKGDEQVAEIDIKNETNGDDSPLPCCSKVASNVAGPGTLQVAGKSVNKSDHFVAYVDIFPLY